jgi:hypothetical protein
MKHKLLVLSLLVVTIFGILYGCGGGGGGNGLGLVRVQVETNNVGQATIGNAGGSVVATGNDGTIYALTIPEDALGEDTLIRVYPVQSIQGAPFSEGVFGGFHLEPAGLVFGKPASLKVTLPPSVVAATYKPFLYTGDGDDIHLEPTTISGQDVTFMIVHFSGGGGGKGSPSTNPSSCEALARHSIWSHMSLQLLNNEPLDPEFLAGILLDWYVDCIKPDLQALMPVESRLPRVFGEWQAWKNYIESGPWDSTVRNAILLELAPELAESRTLAATAIRAVFDQANAQSAVAESLERVKVALYWYRHAVLFDVDDLQNMGIEQIRDDLACKLVVQSQSFPDPITAGQAGNLDITVGYKFDNGPLKFTKVVATIFHSGTTEATQGVGLTSSSSGRLQRLFTRESDTNDLILDVEVSFEDIKLRTIAHRDYPHPIINTQVNVVRAASGGGGTVPFWDDPAARASFIQEPPVVVTDTYDDGHGNITITNSNVYLQYSSPFFQATANSIVTVYWPLTTPTPGVVESPIDDYEPWPGRPIWLTQRNTDGSFTSTDPDNQPEPNGGGYTINPGDGKFTLHYETRQNGTRFTSVSLDLKYTYSGWNSTYEIHSPKRFVREGWGAP